DGVAELPNRRGSVDPPRVDLLEPGSKLQNAFTVPPLVRDSGVGNPSLRERIDNPSRHVFQEQRVHGQIGCDSDLTGPLAEPDQIGHGLSSCRGAWNLAGYRATVRHARKGESVSEYLCRPRRS